MEAEAAGRERRLGGPAVRGTASPPPPPDRVRNTHRDLTVPVYASGIKREAVPECPSQRQAYRECRTRGNQGRLTQTAPEGLAPTGGPSQVGRGQTPSCPRAARPPGVVGAPATRERSVLSGTEPGAGARSHASLSARGATLPRGCHRPTQAAQREEKREQSEHSAVSSASPRSVTCTERRPRAPVWKGDAPRV